MSTKRRNISYGIICATMLIMIGIVIRKPGFLPWGRMATAPASLEGMVTISTSSDKKLTFITCASPNPAILQRLFHSTLSGAFVVQNTSPDADSIVHSGPARIEYSGHLLSVAFADASRYAFTTESEASEPVLNGMVDYSVGLETVAAPGIDSHRAFVASRDWAKQCTSCGRKN